MIRYKIAKYAVDGELEDIIEHWIIDGADELGDWYKGEQSLNLRGDWKCGV